MSRQLNGIAAGGGIAIAPAYLLGVPDLSVKQQHTDNVNHEVARLHDSFAITANELREICQRAHAQLDKQSAVVVDMQLQLVLAEDFQQTIEHQIVTNQYTAGYAVKKETDRWLAENAADQQGLHQRKIAMQDLSKRLLSHILGIELPDPGKLKHQAIIVTHSLTPTDIARFDRRYVVGLVTDLGGSTSHFSIMTKEKSLPSVVGTKTATREILDGTSLIVDGVHGRVLLSPTPAEIDEYEKKAGDYAREMESLGVLKHQRTISADGRHFEIGANVFWPDEAEDAKNSGAEGVGLMRSESLFMGRDTLPSEEEQFQIYKKIIAEMTPERVIIRTLDIGGDKPIASIQTPVEDNPFLGMRSLRFSLAHPEIMRPQLRALLRASVYGRLAIMFPMVSTLDEFLAARKILDEERQKLAARGIGCARQIEVGMMVEVPSAVEMADQLAQYADFFSIGSNDLTQYMFAADRGNSQVAHLYQTLHPAVLRAIKHTVDAAHAEGKWVGICGEMASSSLATPLLLGMGIDEFSMNSSSILPIRSLISELHVRQLQPLVHQAMNARNAKEVQKMIMGRVPVLKNFNF
ncbi:phosphoenolpyruvate--protein phosphotransferase [Limosilactobacillus mucosae]|uniref:phosphoenolpyruvate--protein phosphotransferase n=1 Tax=Limosilactobacillus mucosae TaxID=97478 RepID=UPI00233E93A1|nr:phosphoenolpyruvate--protein phosphotransferase [Limosilactobacillus mucosae]MDC2836559.1 phosphoenolpyruvate--protein phosphotransferase [Limosilactobacillus mucosae]MDC2848770.1 phosphoenolpyruvate--protein phosphotransferase [Limosilactobacillus mucosae]MDC2852769.1 phosphoenolpyruvate--protein phosphotransferase [Limosilactobacillus mucosae]MDD6893694.1 phosphoenolpyruvate--protein phosphotransferase [Lactobacillus sp.]